MKKLLFLSLFCLGFSKMSATISQIRWGSTAGPLDGLTIDWSGTGVADQIRWGYTNNYEMGNITADKRTGISPGISFYKYAFPLVNANSIIYYQLYDSADGLWTAQRIFRTALPSNTQSFSFIAQGDSRSNVNTVWKNIADKVNARNNAFTVFTGDITSSGNNIVQYNDWFNNASNYLGNNIIYHSQGNHDSPSSVTYYQNIFTLPKNNPADTKLYYSFRYGNALFISLNSEEMVSATSPQSVWLKSTLENAKDDPAITWRIVFFHRPLVNAGNHHGEGDSRRDHWGAWFDQYDVDLILNGHDHNYQRTKPININAAGEITTSSQYGTSNGSGMCQMICGGSGAGLYSETSNSDVPLTSIFYQGFNYVQVNIDHSVLTANVYALGDTASATASESLLETVVINKNSPVLAVNDSKINKQNPINVYPNPVGDKLTLQYRSQEQGNVIIKIYDMSARELRSFKMNKKSMNFETILDVSFLNKGIYNISVILDEHRDSTIFIKK